MRELKKLKDLPAPLEFYYHFRCYHITESQKETSCFLCMNTFNSSELVEVDGFFLCKNCGTGNEENDRVMLKELEVKSQNRHHPRWHCPEGTGSTDGLETSRDWP